MWFYLKWSAAHHHPGWAVEKRVSTRNEVLLPHEEASFAHSSVSSLLKWIHIRQDFCESVGLLSFDPSGRRVSTSDIPTQRSSSFLSFPLSPHHGSVVKKMMRKRPCIRLVVHGGGAGAVLSWCQVPACIC